MKKEMKKYIVCVSKRESSCCMKLCKDKIVKYCKMDYHRNIFSTSLIFFVYMYIVVLIDPCYSAFIHPVGNEEYDILLSLAKGEFSTPKTERSNIEKAAVMKYWRSKGKFTVDESGKILLFENKKVSASYEIILNLAVCNFLPFARNLSIYLLLFRLQNVKLLGKLSKNLSEKASRQDTKRFIKE